MKNLLVTGGSGLLGKALIPRLLERKYPVTQLTSSEKLTAFKNTRMLKGDLRSIEDLEGELKEIEIVVHCASNFKDPEMVDVEGTRKLLQILAKGKIKHFIYVSIVGVDKSTFTYYHAKARTERLVYGSGIPFTILRATQFHNLVFDFIQSFKITNSEIFVPKGLRFQSVDISDVAGKLVDCIKDEPGMTTYTLAGPQVLTLEEMVEIFLSAKGLSLEVRITSDRNELFDVFRSGINLLIKPDFSGQVSWKSFIENKER